MTEIDGDDQALAPSWLTCTHRSRESSSPCTGKQVDGFDYCLAHLEPEQLNQALQRLGPGADLEAPGTDISAELFERILAAVASEDGPPTFGSVSLAEAHFIEGVSFVDARFGGDANFVSARFSKGARFDSAQFGGTALFIDARFSGEGDASFIGARFSEGAWFDGAKFSQDARINRVHFKGNASFAGAQFGRCARFDGTCFSQNARFDGANFGVATKFHSMNSGAAAKFDGVNFDGDTGFDGVQFNGDASFVGTRFENTTSLGPLTAGNLILRQAVFVRPVVIEAAAVTVACNRTTWETGVTMRLRYTRIDLKHATFTTRSFIAGINHPFGVTPMLGRLDDSKILCRLPWERRISDDSWMPVVSSLRGADEFNVSFANVDLSQYRRGGRLVLYIGWLVLKAMGRGLLQLLRAIGKFVVDEVKDTLEHLAEQAAPGFGGLLLKLLFALPKLLLTLPLLGAFLAWLLTRHRWLYALVIFVVATAIVAVAYARRRPIADKWSYPIRLRYSPDSGWRASHAQTEVSARRTRWAAAYDLVGLRRRLIKAETALSDHPLKCPLPNQAAHWGQVHRSLQAWAEFPINSSSRPLILLGPTVLVAPLPDGKAQAAFAHCLIEAVPGFPAEILHALRYYRGAGTCACLDNQEIAACELTETLRHRHRISTQNDDAPTNLIDRQRQQGEPPIEPLLVTTALPGCARFLTDRGQQELPAWEVHAQGIQQPIWVLDPKTSQQAWRPPGLAGHELSWRGSIAQLTADERTIALSFSVIADQHIIYPGVDVIMEEEAPVVAVIPVPVDTRPRDPRQPHKQRWEVSAPLSWPLGPRVLLDGNGCPVLVRSWRSNPPAMRRPLLAGSPGGELLAGGAEPLSAWTSEIAHL